MKSLTIGQLAKKAQVNVETARYYRRLGLMPEEPLRFRKESIVLHWGQFERRTLYGTLFFRSAT